MKIAARSAVKFAALASRPRKIDDATRIAAFRAGDSSRALRSII
jgi:hypothetical protein